MLLSRDQFTHHARYQHGSDVDRIDDSDNRSVRGDFVREKREARFPAPAPVDHLAAPRARAIRAALPLTGGFEPHCQRLDDQQALAAQVIIFHGGHNAAHDAAEVHRQVSMLMVSTMPMIVESTGVSLQPSAMRAELPATASTVSRNPALTVSTETTYPGSSFPSGLMGLRISSFFPSRRGSFRVATTLPTTRARIIYLPPLDLPIGSTSSRLGWGRAMTCTAISSPTRRAAAAPESVAALTAATSPRTSAVTYPEPIFSQPTSETFAAFTIASEASIIATKPRVSIIPNASPIQPPNPY